ncbi:hypothetical protein, partial [Pseudomonas carnis]|uniref:hypothetical protein n=1 Tax=Pseudomonas carnis TaxID=2487355 RepID=UPI001E44A991
MAMPQVRERRALFVGASLLAKNYQTPRSFRKPALSLTFFASKLAPMYGLAPTFNPLFKHWYPVASMYQAYPRKLQTASGQHWISSRS